MAIFIKLTNKKNNLFNFRFFNFNEIYYREYEENKNLARKSIIRYKLNRPVLSLLNIIMVVS